MEQIIFDSSCLLKWTTFLKDLSYAFDLFKPFIPWSGISFFVFYSSHPFFKVYCVIFICCTTCCHSLSFIVTRCLSLSFSVTRCTTRCHSLPFVVPLIVTHCTTCCHSVSLSAIRCQSVYHLFSLDAQLDCLFINDLYLKSFCKNKKLANLQMINSK